MGIFFFFLQGPRPPQATMWLRPCPHTTTTTGPTPEKSQPITDELGQPIIGELEQPIIEDEVERLHQRTTPLKPPSPWRRQTHVEPTTHARICPPTAILWQWYPVELLSINTDQYKHGGPSWERERLGQRCDEREARTLWREREMRNRENEERESGRYVKYKNNKKNYFVLQLCYSTVTNLWWYCSTIVIFFRIQD